MSYEKDLRLEKNYSIKIAKQLCYPEEVVDEINAAASSIQIQQILAKARHNAKGVNNGQRKRSKK